VARVARVVDVPVTADMEAGYGLEPDELAGRLLDTGAVGLNLEDSDHGNRSALVPVERHAERIAALKRAGDVVVNARVDVHLRGGSTDEALARAAAYRDAGADCVYPIALGDEAALEAFVARAGVPVNALWTRDAPPPGRLAELGVARVSVGGGLFAAVQQQAEALVARLRAGDPTALVDD